MSELHVREQMRTQVLSIIESQPGVDGRGIVRAIIGDLDVMLASCISELSHEGHIVWGKDPRAFGHKDAGWKVVSE